MTVRITVVGDVLLDRDVLGTVSRVCPDAPAPVLDIDDEVVRPGGAGLAAALLAEDDVEVTLVAAVGDDEAGRQVARLLSGCGVRLVAVPTMGATREKTRVRAGGQSLVRLDRGTLCPPADGLPGAALDALDGPDAVLVCDYAGGMTADPDVRRVLTSTAAALPVVWDPHLRGQPPVPGCRLVTPNAQEAATLAGARSADASRFGDAGRQAESLLTTWRCHAVCVTLGHRGALMSYGAGPPLVIPAEQVQTGDSCGAGDRFAAAAAHALAEGEILSHAVQHAVAAASVFVAAGGASGTSFGPREHESSKPAGLDHVERVRSSGGTVVATGGCFDLLHAGHVALLRAARALGDCLVVCVNSDDSVRRLKGATRPLVPQADRVRVLEALASVDAVVVFDEDTPERVLAELRPDIWAKGGDYVLSELPESEVVSRWAGQTVLVPYLDGRSTTALIGAVTDRATTVEEKR